MACMKLKGFKFIAGKGVCLFSHGSSVDKFCFASVY